MIESVAMLPRLTSPGTFVTIISSPPIGALTGEVTEAVFATVVVTAISVIGCDCGKVVVSGIVVTLGSVSGVNAVVTVEISVNIVLCVDEDSSLLLLSVV